jgi:predicted SprT family Zn-dependent metalloprotease
MNTHTRPPAYPTAAQSPAEKRKKKHDFVCECGEEWNTPGHAWWVCRMYCTACGEIVEAE